MPFLKKHYGLVSILLLSFWAIKPFFSPGFFPMHDDTQVARVFEMGKALRDGMFPVRWVQDLGYGYGYPIFNFYAPLSYYVGGFFTLLGFDALIATKIMTVVGIILSGVFMYLVSREFWGELGGVVSGLFYIYAPYHAFDIYVRGDIGEIWGYAFIPLMFWGFYKVFNSPRRSQGRCLVTSEVLRSDSSEVGVVWKWVVVASVGYAGVILSHNLTAMMVTPFLVIAILLYCFIAYTNKNLSSIFYLLSSIVLGLMLSAFYWIPALLEMKYTNVLSQLGGGADFRDHFVCISQLWESNWGFGGSIPGCVDGLSFRIGKLHLLSVFVALFLLFVTKRYFSKTEAKHANDINHYSEMTKLVTLVALGFMISIFFTLEISKSIWEAIPIMAFLQFPWRFLLLASFFASLVLGSLIWVLQQLLKPGLSIYFKPGLHIFAVVGILLFFLIHFNSKLFQPQTLVLKTSEDYTNEKTLKWFASKISDEYMPVNFVKPVSMSEVAKNKISILQGELDVIEQSNKTHKIYYLIDVKKETKLKINIAYFPAWNVFLDGKKVLYTISDNGLTVLLPEGRHRLDMEFIQTSIEKNTNGISLISLIVLFIGIILKRKMLFGKVYE